MRYAFINALVIDAAALTPNACKGRHQHRFLHKIFHDMFNIILSHQSVAFSSLQRDLLGRSTLLISAPNPLLSTYNLLHYCFVFIHLYNILSILLRHHSRITRQISFIILLNLRLSTVNSNMYFSSCLRHKLPDYQFHLFSTIT